MKPAVRATCWGWEAGSYSPSHSGSVSLAQRALCQLCMAPAITPRSCPPPRQLYSVLAWSPSPATGQISSRTVWADRTKWLASRGQHVLQSLYHRGGGDGVLPQSIPVQLRPDHTAATVSYHSLVNRVEMVDNTIVLEMAQTLKYGRVSEHICSSKCCGQENEKTTCD